ncbi:YafY family transcriptional regulator [Streptomyces sp. P38-E01]|uniref:YafY family transcriptional regulator n=1 Tax=Streptomyces tardus TaxID=2780544 RepID=A0A949JR87_9ACTN|nr:YafY family protein [Streptomyces tardus]MBU7599791.1 YafY family transcriptional regulator [Streptomyces tardus]
MVETSARLLRLLALLQTRREWSGGALSDRLGVSPRTVRRDVERLRGLGYPVHSATGTAGGYRLGAGAQLPPLLLDDEEAVAVAVGLRAAVNSGVSGVEESSVRALGKLEQVLPHRLRRRVGALNSFTAPMRHRVEGPSIEAATLVELAHACRDHTRLRFHYESHDGSATARVVEPCGLVSSYRRWYLVGWDTGRGDWRTFRVDRLTLAPPHGPRFEPRTPPAEDLAAYVSEGVSTRAHAVRATVLLRMPVERAAAVVRPSTGSLEAVDADSCLLRTGSYSLEAVVIHLLFYGVDFTVLEPVEMLDQLAAMRDRLSRSLDSSKG